MGNTSQNLTTPKMSKRHSASTNCSDKSTQTCFSEQKYFQFLKRIEKRTNCLHYSWVNVFRVYMKERPSDLYKFYSNYCIELKARLDQTEGRFTIPFLENRFLRDFSKMYGDLPSQVVTEELVMKAFDEVKAYLMIMQWFEEPFRGVSLQKGPEESNTAFSTVYITVFKVLRQMLNHLLQSQKVQLLAEQNKTSNPQLFNTDTYDRLYGSYDLNQAETMEINNVLLTIEKQFHQLLEKGQQQFMAEIMKLLDPKSVFIVVKITYQLGLFNVDKLWAGINRVLTIKA